jgi:hypothetical protein
MSGRTRHWRDGELITNRKTDRRNPRTRHEDQPELRFIFTLPRVLMSFVSTGEHNSVTVEADGRCTVHGKDREWVLKKAAEFLREIAHDMVLPVMAGVLFCPRYPAPTLGAPDRPGYQDNYQIVVASANPAVVISRTGLAPMVVT